jgi:hypothetical protein
MGYMVLRLLHIRSEATTVFECDGHDLRGTMTLLSQTCLSVGILVLFNYS